MKSCEFSSCLLIIHVQTALQFIDVVLRLLSYISQQTITLEENSFNVIYRLFEKFNMLLPSMT